MCQYYERRLMAFRKILSFLLNCRRHNPKKNSWARNFLWSLENDSWILPEKLREFFEICSTCLETVLSTSGTTRATVFFPWLIYAQTSSIFKFYLLKGSFNCLAEGYIPQNIFLLPFRFIVKEFQITFITQMKQAYIFRAFSEHTVQ